LYAGVTTLNAETAAGSNGTLLVQDIVEGGKVTARSIQSADGKPVRLHEYDYVQDRQSAMKIWRFDENGVKMPEPDVTVSFQEDQSTGRRTQAQVRFTQSEYRDYCVLFSYDTNGNLSHQVVQ